MLPVEVAWCLIPKWSNGVRNLKMARQVFIVKSEIEDYQSCYKSLLTNFFRVQRGIILVDFLPKRINHKLQEILWDSQKAKVVDTKQENREIGKRCARQCSIPHHPAHKSISWFIWLKYSSASTAKPKLDSITFPYIYSSKDSLSRKMVFPTIRKWNIFHE